MEVMLPFIQEMQQQNSKAVTAFNEGELMSRKEAAAYLKITLVTLHARTRQGVIECRRINSRVYYLRSKLERLPPLGNDLFAIAV